MLLYPQLPHHVAAHLTDRLRRLSVAEAADLTASEHPETVFTPTGGTRVDPERLADLRSLLLRKAVDNGYPAGPSEAQRLNFDQLASVALHTRMQIHPAEAAKRGVWEFTTCILAPDLVRWRFSGEGNVTSPDRFFAGRRNTFQRLWWRAHLLHDPVREDTPYALIGLLGEDEIVQLMERPNLAAIRTLTTRVGAGLVAAAERHPSTPRRVLIRETQKHLMRLSSFILFDILNDDQLKSLTDQLFDKVASVRGSTHGRRSDDGRQSDAGAAEPYDVTHPKQEHAG